MRYDRAGYQRGKYAGPVAANDCLLRFGIALDQVDALGDSAKLACLGATLNRPGLIAWSPTGNEDFVVSAKR